MDMELTQSLCEKILPVIEPLAQKVKLKVFGYRKFFLDGKSFCVSSSLEWTKFSQEKFEGNIISNYEDEVNAALRNEKHFVLRIGEPDRQDVYLSTLHDCDIWNTLSLYKLSEDSVDAFYFASTRDNHKIGTEYINNLDFFEKFSHSFKSKFGDMISPQDVKRLSLTTVSPHIFENTSLKNSS